MTTEADYELVEEASTAAAGTATRAQRTTAVTLLAFTTADPSLLPQLAKALGRAGRDATAPITAEVGEERVVAWAQMISGLKTWARNRRIGLEVSARFGPEGPEVDLDYEGLEAASEKELYATVAQLALAAAGNAPLVTHVSRGNSKSGAA